MFGRLSVNSSMIHYCIIKCSGEELSFKNQQYFVFILNKQQRGDVKITKFIIVGCRSTAIACVAVDK